MYMYHIDVLGANPTTTTGALPKGMIQVKGGDKLARTRVAKPRTGTSSPAFWMLFAENLSKSYASRNCPGGQRHRGRRVGTQGDRRPQLSKERPREILQTAHTAHSVHRAAVHCGGRSVLRLSYAPVTRQSVTDSLLLRGRRTWPRRCVSWISVVTTGPATSRDERPGALRTKRGKQVRFSSSICVRTGESV